MSKIWVLGDQTYRRTEMLIQIYTYNPLNFNIEKEMIILTDCIGENTKVRFYHNWYLYSRFNWKGKEHI